MYNACIVLLYTVCVCYWTSPVQQWACQLSSLRCDCVVLACTWRVQRATGRSHITLPCIICVRCESSGRLVAVLNNIIVGNPAQDDWFLIRPEMHTAIHCDTTRVVAITVTILCCLVLGGGNIVIGNMSSNFRPVQVILAVKEQGLVEPL